MMAQCNKPVIALVIGLAVGAALPAGAEAPGPDSAEAANRPVLLRWKVPKKGAIGFETSLDPIDPDKEQVISVDIRRLFGDEVPKRVKTQLHKLLMPERFSMVSIVRPSGKGDLSVKMIVPKAPEARPEGVPEAAWKKMRSAMTGVQLRGSMTNAGQITSFYLESKQKNLIALMFQLPKKPVKVGDSWSLDDVNFIRLSHGFICKKAQRVNRVRLVSLSPADEGDRTAVLEYVVAESVDGKFRHQMMPKSQPVSYTFSFIARGEFLVGKGAWRSFVGEMRITATGKTDAEVTKRIAMRPMRSVPAELLKME